MEGNVLTSLFVYFMTVS